MCADERFKNFLIVLLDGAEDLTHAVRKQRVFFAAIFPPYAPHAV